MRTKASWAYDFLCDRSLEDIIAVLDKESPWAWEVRDSAWYGDYLSTSPAADCRVTIHSYPYAGDAGWFLGLHDSGFSALLRIGTESPAERPAVDETFHMLLAKLGARSLTEIEPYD